MKKIGDKRIVASFLVILMSVLYLTLPTPVDAAWFDIISSPLDFASQIVGEVLLRLASLFSGLGGLILNFSVWFTVVNMAENIENIGAIETTWAVVRDVANMGFIFVLIYASIKTILGMGSDIRRLIINIVIAAILINFSLFATRLVIDASNIVATTFYSAMTPEAVESDGSLDLTTQGLSNAYTSVLDLQKIYDAGKAGEEIDSTTILTVGVVGSIILLVAAFSFFLIAILLFIRYAVLIFLMILSPIAFVAQVLPGISDYGKKWRDALFGQAIFAPLFLFLTWISLYILQNTKVQIQSANISSVGFSGGLVTLLVQSIIVITFMVITIVVSKDFASRVPGGLNKVVGWASGVAGGATFGMAGRLGRNTFGRVGAAVGESERLKDIASKGGARGMAARLSLAAGRKTAKQNFDLRGTPIGGGLDAGKAQKGGFEKTLKDKRKKEADFAKSLGPSDTLITDAERKMEKAEATAKAAGVKPWEDREYLEARKEVDRLKGVNEEEAKKRIKKEKGFDDNALKSYLNSSEGKKDLGDRQSKGLVDKRKAQRIEALENSPTSKLAGVISDAGRYVSEKPLVQDVSEKFSRAATGLDKAGERSASKIQGIGNKLKVPTFARMAGNVVKGTIVAPATVGRYTSDAVKSVPNLIKAKNRAAVAEIKKGKKSVKDQLEKILKDQDEIKEKEEGDSGDSGAPPAGEAPAGGETPATP